MKSSSLRLPRLALGALSLLALTSVALAHGGAYQPPPPIGPKPRGPPGSIPPGLRGPTTPGGQPGGPTTGGGAGPRGPVTGGPGSSPGPTTGSGPSKGPIGPSTGGPPRPGPGPRSGGTSPDHWSRWWFANRVHLVDLSARVSSGGAVTPGGDGTVAEAWRDRATAVLASHLNDDNEDIASGCAIAIGKSGDPSHTGALVALLEDDKRQDPVREAAALALGLMGQGASYAESTKARQALEAVAGDRRESTRLRGAAVYGMGLRGDIASLPFLLDVAGAAAAQWDVPTAGITSLGLVGEDLARTDLEAMLKGPRARKRRQWMRRVYAAHGLARLGDKAALPALVLAAKDKDDDIRRAAVLALGALADENDDDVADVLVRIVHRDKDRPARNMAVLSLARIGHRKAESALRYAYKKGDSLHQPFAALALGLLARRSGDPSLVNVQVKDLKTRANANLRAALSIAVGLGRNQKAAPILRQVVADRGNPELRAHAALGLGLLGKDGGGADVLRTVLKDENDPKLRRESALALGLLGDREAVGILLDVIRKENSIYVQGSAAVAIGRIGGSESAKVLLELLENERRPKVARGMAAVGLGLTLDRTQGRGLSRVGADLNWYALTPTVREILTIF